MTGVGATFDQNVIIDAEEIELVGAAGKRPAYYDFIYEGTAHTAPWYLATPIASDQVIVSLDADGATTDGKDGVWSEDESDPSEGSYFDAGDPELLDVLCGDVDGNGLVDFNDLYVCYLAIGHAYDGRNDIEADGRVDVNDLYFIYEGIGH